MGGRLTRMLSKFNVENRAYREISKNKPKPAPHHPAAAAPDWSASFQEEIKKKDEKLLTLLKDVYVDSSDPGLQRKKKGRNLPHKQEDYRPVIDGQFNYLDIQTVPKGKVLIEEALTLLNNHQRSPETWTAEKIAEKYSLELKDVNNLLTFFIPFVMDFLPYKDSKTLDSK
ncbi:NADH dehydrogenase [ubiquinone] 1 alpha subcomplex assembly factor 4 [Pseudonaja textilis]|uniref:NADH dehydrogenase [ubiquinone] 1 alpha subcomplex assembly factor 4 n=1 Tax=Pseudonaja textilis TaxID=8673 RepID=A0A670YIR5_PSETE|nr:NADH dehydrogenase [ubiquinone] 1 alpha subcomplex assembly factor 4 [Pseudonaja textilis]